MVQYCIAFGCKNNSNTAGISFHVFPADKHRFKQWEIQLKRDVNKCGKISKHMRLCSAHFKQDDFRSDTKQNRKLKDSAVPSIFSYIVSPPPRRKIAYKKHATLEHDNKSAPDDHLHAENASTSTNTLDFVDISLLDQIKNLKQELWDKDLELSKCRQEVYKLQQALDDKNRHITIKQSEIDVEQTTSQHLNNKIKVLTDELLKNEKILENISSRFTLQNVKTKTHNLTYYTGFDDISIFNAFCEFVIPENKVHPILHGREAVNRAKVISVEDELLLVLSKLRQDFDNIDLAARFGISRQLVGRIFKSWVDYLYNYLGNLNIWPHRNIIFANAAKDFIKDYPNTIIILDGTEIRSQTPSSLVRQTQYYSYYKSSNTVKALIGCDPNGAIIFISQLYTGSISDKEICLKSNLFEILSEKIKSGEIKVGDTVMCDKGFNIEKELKELGLNINIPAFASFNSQFEPEEVSDTRKIASKRVVVEMVIRKVKSFKILSNVATITEMSQLNQIFTICCLLSNFRFTLKNKES